MPKRSVNSPLLGLSRPEYAASPEMLLSALAEKLVEVNVESESNLPIGFVYFLKQQSLAKRVLVQETNPYAVVAEWQQIVANSGMQSDANQFAVAQAVAESLKGVQADKAKSIAALPLTVNLALLQNARGMQGKANPADHALILHQMFSLGSDEECSESIFALWQDACDRRVASDPLVAAIDRAIASSLRTWASLNQVSADLPDVRLPEGVTATPFHWLYENWRLLSSPAWVDALPARVWNDWATTILRLAYGLGYLWEASWYQVLATRLLRGEDPFDYAAVAEEVGYVLPWRSSHEPTSVRDVGPLLNLQIRQGHVVLGILRDWQQGCLKQDEVDAQETFERMAVDPKLRASLIQARASQSRSVGKQSWEAVRYTLMARSSAQTNGDNYGLFQRVGASNKFVVVEPTIEMISMLASLACREPGKTTTLAAVAQSFGKLGISPNNAELLRLLERAGLARGSADADQAVIVTSAF